jgi:hypothetical protein
MHWTRGGNLRKPMSQKRDMGHPAKSPALKVGKQLFYIEDFNAASA